MLTLGLMMFIIKIVKWICAVFAIIFLCNYFEDRNDNAEMAKGALNCFWSSAIIVLMISMWGLVM